MSVSPEQAAEALRDVARARSRSIEFNAYRVSSPQLILWGIFWILGYGLSDLAPERSKYVWPAIGVLWMAQSFFYNRQAGAKTGRGKKAVGWRFVGIFATIYVFIFCTALIMRPHGMAMAAFVPMLIAAFYTIVGMWAGWRFSAIGIGLAVLTIAGFFLLHAHFLLWMAVVGGGALIVTGLWLRSA